MEEVGQDNVGWDTPLFWVRAERQPEFAQYWLQGEGGPGLVIMHGGRRRGAVHIKLWSTVALRAFVTRVTRQAEPTRPWPKGGLPWVWGEERGETNAEL